MADPVRNIFIDERMEHYEGFIPEDWAPKMFGPVKPDSALDNLLLDLLLGWRSTAYTASMPATAIKVAQSSTLGYAKYVSPDSMVVAHTETIVAKASRKIPELVEDRRLRAELLKELATAACEVRDARSSVTPEMPTEPIWADFLKQDAFAQAVWSSQRVSYVAFYNAYEAFLVESAKLALGVEQLRATDKEFKEGLRTGFGKDISVPCWSHHEINNAREVRHALSHADGRETKALKKLRHGITLLHGRLQIVPGDNHKLLGRLRSGVQALVDAVEADSRFSSPTITSLADSPAGGEEQ